MNLPNLRRLFLVSLIASVSLLAGCKDSAPASAGQVRQLQDALDEKQSRLTGSMRTLAERHMPGRLPDPWGRPLGWSSLDLRTPPDLGFGIPDAATAETINALRPLSSLPVRPMQPFVLVAGPDDSARALTCLTQAIYYEAAVEPVEGMQAVAQTVLNRLRHPGYP